jgi:OmpA-OmpF porin, OOP family
MLNAIRSTRCYLLYMALLLSFQATAVLAAHPDEGRGSDPALFSRMAHFYLSYDVKAVEFADFEFRTDKADRMDSQVVEGRYAEYIYDFDDSSGATCPSALQIVRNYQNAAIRAGGQIMNDKPRDFVTMRFQKDGKETWAMVEPHGDGVRYRLVIVEKQSMKQTVAAYLDAGTLASGLSASGHVALPGIYFDFGKADVKPESEPALKEIVRLLQNKQSLKVWIVGHTDYVGTVESNVSLSAARAAAVVRVLTQRFGIDAKRLGQFGAGPYTPIASNRTDDGRARNRRVEAVEQP